MNRRLAAVGAVAVSVAACSGGGGGGGKTTIHGLFDINRNRGSGNSLAPDTEVFGAIVSGSFSYDLKQITDGALDTCDTHVPLSGSGNSFPADAGASITVTGPGGVLDVPTIAFAGLYGTSTSESFFAFNGSYTVSAPGGAEVAAFTANGAAPSGVNVTAPDFSAAVVVDRATDLAVAWTSTGGTDPVLALITQYDSNDNLKHGVFCRFTDDGTGTIPAASLSGLSTDGTLSSEIDVFKEVDTLFPSPAGQALMRISDMWEADATVQ